MTERTDGDGQSRRIPPWVNTLVRWTVAAAALAFLVRFILQNGQELRQEQLSPNWWMLFISFLLLFVYMAGRVLAWHQITIHLGAKIPLRGASGSWLTSLLGKYLPGKVFLLLGRLELYTAHGQSKVKTTVAFTIETLVSMLSSVYTILIALLFVDVDLGRSFTGPLLVLLVALTAGLHPQVMRWALAGIGRLTKRELPEITVTYREMLLFVGVGTAVWVLFGGAFYVFVNALYVLPVGYLLYLTGAISAASLLGILAIIAPSGLGVREGFLTLMLAQVMPAPAAAVVSLASRVWVTVAELIAIGIGGILSRSSRESLSTTDRMST